MRKIIIGIVSFIFIIGFVYFTSVKYETITITDKENVVRSESSKYLIFTETEVFENTDSFIFFKFNSSDIYNQLKLNETYKVKVVGWRIPFLSQYRNIIKIEI